MEPGASPVFERQSDVRRLPLLELISACRREAQQSRRGESTAGAPGYELFRRAVCDGDQAAWDTIVDQYRGQVRGWVRRHPTWPLVAHLGDDDDRVIRAFERFWLAVHADRFHGFPTLPSLLAYLKLCVHCAVVDEGRAAAAGVPEARRQALQDDPAGAAIDAAWPGAPSAESAEAEVVRLATTRDLWQVVTRELPDEAERLVVYLSFVHDLRPREIQAAHPDRYPAIGDVYRAKRSALYHLRQSEQVGAVLRGG